LTMSPIEIRVIRRLSSRSNVLPVIARADSLTDEMLAAVKEAVRTGLRDAGLGFGVFDPVGKLNAPGQGAKEDVRKTSIDFADERSNGHGEEDEEEDDEDDVGEHVSRSVIKLRPTRRPGRLSRSRSRRDLADADSPDANDRESVANIRFSAHLIVKSDISALLPFALIAPGDVAKRHKRPESILTTSAQEPSEDGHLDASSGTPTHSSSPHSARNMPPYLHGPPDDLKGVFTRKFRWGTVDVLDPNHCDFAALRTAVLSTHLKILKTHTKEVLYEKYRTEKLLARRATRNISDEERQRLLEDLGL